ncbi:hypothetical protein Bca52824_045199 [Brassica carinata]|uniref:Neprosin PEP catalytic domain-containing protein n=1 Tax=Brassica carinata TaxID=52824 RepID=A0A8X7REJ4_BRACI|nr:hypothetical protein Bca52824_045199 [Brassica carinata]
MAMDVSSGNWKLKLDNEVIGYWPKELFTDLNKGASLVTYWGYIRSSGDSFSFGGPGGKCGV